VGGKVHVEIVKPDGVGEAPVLIGNTSHLQINLVKGRAAVQVQCLCLGNVLFLTAAWG
jgi:hypothetical protein